MIIKLLTYSIVILTLACVAMMLYKLRKQPAQPLSASGYFRLLGSGIVAFVADTIGVGSFAVNTMLAKILGTFKDEELPAMNNGAQVIPGAIESFFFMQFVEVDVTTLLSLVVGTCIGGLLGGGVISRLSKQGIRLAMMICFSIIIALLACKQLNILPVGGTAIELHSWKLVIGFFGMVVCGALTSAGVGLFAMIQGVLFLLNVSPVVAFPIMMTAGAMQQPLTTMMFLQQDKIPLKRTLILSLGGCIGVAIILPIFSHFTVTWLHSLLLMILCYNLFAISRTYLRSRFGVATLTQEAM
ncbi:MAG: TSUP family transporter [Legionellaceae bacterium]|nr:TSUP family transporter [Legionellaceae bacterium]